MHTDLHGFTPALGLIEGFGTEKVSGKEAGKDD